MTPRAYLQSHKAWITNSQVPLQLLQQKLLEIWRVKRAPTIGIRLWQALQMNNFILCWILRFQTDFFQLKPIEVPNFFMKRPLSSASLSSLATLYPHLTMQIANLSNNQASLSLQLGPPTTIEDIRLTSSGKKLYRKISWFQKVDGLKRSETKLIEVEVLEE